METKEIRRIMESVLVGLVIVAGAFMYTYPRTQPKDKLNLREKIEKYANELIKKPREEWTELDKSSYKRMCEVEDKRVDEEIRKIIELRSHLPINNDYNHYNTPSARDFYSSQPDWKGRNYEAFILLNYILP